MPLRLERYYYIATTHSTNPVTSSAEFFLCIVARVGFWSALIVCLVHLSLPVGPRYTSRFSLPGSPFVNSRQLPPPQAQASVQTRSTSFLDPQCTLDEYNSRPPRGWTPRRAPLRRLVSLEQTDGVQTPFRAADGRLRSFLGQPIYHTHICISGLGPATSLPSLINCLAPPIRSCERGYVSWPNPDSLASNQTFPQSPSPPKAASAGCLY